MSPEERRNLAEQQAGLVRGLAGQSGLPAGFNRNHLATAAASLLAKRRRGVERTWPGLAESLGDRFRQVFAQYARSHPLPAEGAHADGREFAHYLLQTNALADDGRLQLFLAELGPRRPVGIAFLPGQRALVIAFSLVARDGLRFASRDDRRGHADFSQPVSAAAK